MCNASPVVCTRTEKLFSSACQIPDSFHPSRCWQTQTSVHWAELQSSSQCSSEGGKQTKISPLRLLLLLCFTQLHFTKWPLSFVLFSDLSRVKERDHEPAFQWCAVARVGAASSRSDTEAGPRCAWSIYTCRRDREGQRSTNLLDQTIFTEKQKTVTKQSVTLQSVFLRPAGTERNLVRTKPFQKGQMLTGLGLVFSFDAEKPHLPQNKSDY